MASGGQSRAVVCFIPLPDTPVQVGGATATGRGAGRNVARPETVLRLLGQGAAGGVSTEQQAAFTHAKELLQHQLAKAQGRGLGQGQLSAAA
jgi:hypothetical protein